MPRAEVTVRAFSLGIFVLALTACGDDDKSGGGDAEEAGGDVTAQDVCQQFEDANSTCEFTTTTTTATSGSSCEEQFGGCTTADLEILLDYGACVEENCDGYSDCIYLLGQVSSDCLGTGGTTTATSLL